MQAGYVQVYTGDGKGKTTALLGLALRAVGANKRVYIGQFIKKGDYSEVKAIRNYLPQITLEQYGEGFVLSIPSAEHTAAAQNGLARARAALLSGEYDLVMLDEINVAVDLGLIPVAELLDLIRAKPEGIELVLTGRNAAAEIIAAADLVSEVKEIKHYYAKGVSAREGIEM
ncbi:MAG: cob(I)yrinic acid a,c-diamide adenosyltransferase [Clostridiales bacterium]|nr:cob(I)yrinic acid a,c-diamide adenosyltransferase [Clostridiales bacterium]